MICPTCGCPLVIQKGKSVIYQAPLEQTTLIKKVVKDVINRLEFGDYLEGYEQRILVKKLMDILS